MDANSNSHSPVVWVGPQYADYTLNRIVQARLKAEKDGKRVWSLGVNPRTGDKSYMVLSSSPEAKPYYLAVRSTGERGGFCYTLGNDPVCYIRCTCISFTEHKNPCKHGARVSLRLERVYHAKQYLEQVLEEEEAKDEGEK